MIIIKILAIDISQLFFGADLGIHNFFTLDYLHGGSHLFV